MSLLNLAKRPRPRSPWERIYKLLSARDESSRFPLIAGFKMRQLLGRGGMGEVYEASDLESGQVVAIKLLINGNEASLRSRRRFRREFQVLRQLNHPGLVKAFKYGQTEGLPYFTMERLGGTHLGAYLKGRPWDTQARLTGLTEVFTRLLTTLEYVHSQGVLHCDLKPQNVLIDPFGRPRLLDFGLALQEGLTTGCYDDEMLGTPQYMSPEQIRGDHMDVRSDLYSLGVLMHECISGHPPFEATDLESVFQNTLETPAPRLADLPSPVSDLIQALLAKDPTRRPSSARQVKHIWSKLHPHRQAA